MSFPRVLTFTISACVCLTLLLCACDGQEPPDVTVTPIEDIVPGKSGPKQGEPDRDPNLPEKDAGEELPPINEGGEDKLDAEKVQELEPGAGYERGDDSAKPAPGDVEVEESDGSKAPKRSPEPSDNYAQIQYRMTADSIEPVHLALIPGTLIASKSIDGEFIYIVSVAGQPVHAGSFRDPLVAVGLPGEEGQGYSSTRMEEGYFNILVPGNLVVRDALPETTIDFYRLDPSVPRDTPLDPNIASELIVRSKPFASLDARGLIELLESNQ